jgi:DNA polymerase III epsilon subunit-like protein
MRICFIYTDTNGLHKTNDFVSTKNLYKFARLIAIHYMIGEYNNTSIINQRVVDIILKPKTIYFDKVAQSFHKITMEDANNKGIDNKIAISEFKNDLSDVKIIVGHSLPFHIKAIQSECFRTAIDINFAKYILIDTISFGHSYEHPKFADMLVKYNINKKLTQLEQYRDLFFILYSNYIKSINIKNSINNNNTNVKNDECDFID